MWQSSNGAVHIKRTPLTLKKQQQSFCLSFILVLCCAFVNPVPTTAGSSSRLSSLWSPCESDSQTAHWWKNLQPIFATWRTSRPYLCCLPPSFLFFFQCYHCISLFYSQPTPNTPPPLHSEFYQPDTHSPSLSPLPQSITHLHLPSLFTSPRSLLIALVLQPVSLNLNRSVAHSRFRCTRRHLSLSQGLR